MTTESKDAHEYFRYFKNQINIKLYQNDNCFNSYNDKLHIERKLFNNSLCIKFSIGIEKCYKIFFHMPGHKFSTHVSISLNKMLC